MLKTSTTPLDGLIVIEPYVFSDDRGYFFEAYRKPVFQDLGLPTEYVQDNQAASLGGVVRGLHYQLNYPQGKLVRVILGTVLDIAVDIRRGSPTFGQSFAVELTDEDHQMMYIPEGFAHGYSVLSDRAIFHYKCTEIYHPEDEYGIRWDDPDLAIDWKLNRPIVSDKDKQLPLLSQIDSNFLPIYEEQE